MSRDILSDPEAMVAIQTLRVAGRRLGIEPRELARMVADLVDPSAVVQKQREEELYRATKRALELRAEQERADWGVPDPIPMGPRIRF